MERIYDISILVIAGLSAFTAIMKQGSVITTGKFPIVFWTIVLMVGLLVK